MSLEQKGRLLQCVSETNRLRFECKSYRPLQSRPTAVKHDTVSPEAPQKRT